MSNVISVSGNLAKDAEIKTDKKGNDRVVFSIADNVGFGDRQHTNWFNCIMFGKRGVAVQQYLTKGKEVTVHGEMKLEEYTTAEGELRKTLSLNAQNIVLHKGGGGQQPQSRQESSTHDDDEWML